MAHAGERRPSRIIEDLGRWAGLSDSEIERLGRIAPTLEDLADAVDSGAEELPAAGLERLRVAASLALLPGVDIVTALSLADEGLTVAALGEGSARAVDAAQRFDLPPVTLATAARGAEGPAATVPKPFDEVPPTSPVARPVVVAREMTWAKLAAELYGIDARKAKKVAPGLAGANGSSVDEPVGAGARIVAPDFATVPLRAPAGAEAMGRFASYLGAENAHALANAGFSSPEAFLYIDAQRDGRVTDVPPAVLERVRLQAGAVKAGVPADVAHAVAAMGPWDSFALLAGAEPARFLQTLDAAKASGLVTSAYSIVTVYKWIGAIGLANTGIHSHPEPLDTPCDGRLPTDANLENVYDYRAIPAGRSASDLSAALAHLRQLQQELPSVPKQAAEEHWTLILQALGVTQAHRATWVTWGYRPPSPSDNFDTRATTYLNDLADFLAESIELTELLAELAAGHEAFRHDEIGLALAAYARAETWFVERQADPALARYIEPGTAGLPAAADTWYRSRADGAALPGAKFLDKLQTDLDGYQGFRLRPWNELAGVTSEPFRVWLYYLRRFVLPLCRHDCQLELGNFCGALNELLSIRNLPAYTNPLDPGRETTIAMGGPNLPAVLQAGLDPSGWGRFPESFLHPVEKRLVDVRAASLMRRWGEHHERRADPVRANDADARLARGRYAQTLRILFDGWNVIRDLPVSTIEAFRTGLRQGGLGSMSNPLAVEQAAAAHLGLTRLRNKLNFIGYDSSYVPSWRMEFLLNSARYYAEHARQLERDSLQFQSSAEQEQMSQRLLVQQVATAASQLAVESRRGEEAAAAVAVADAAAGLAEVRRANGDETRREWAYYGPEILRVGTIGGVMGAAGGVLSFVAGNVGGAGAPFGPITQYLTGEMELTMRSSALVRQQRELNGAVALSQAEQQRAVLGVELARLQRVQAAATLAYAQSNLEFATAKALSADFWFAAARRTREFAQRYLDAAIRMAFLTEQAFEFAAGRRIDRIKFDYASSDNRLAADALLADLDSIEAERIFSSEETEVPVRYVIPLRIRDLPSFETLKRTGTIRFDTTIAELDLAHPGTYFHRLLDVEVEIHALTTPTGIRGTLTKGGLSWLRFPSDDSGPAANVVQDWITDTPTRYRLAPLVREERSLVLSSFDTRRDSLVMRGANGSRLGLLEGDGCGSTWTLTFDPASNDFDLATLTDVNIVLYFTAKHDPALEEAVRLERQKGIARGTFPFERTLGYSFQESQPDTFYHLLNGVDGATDFERVVGFDVAAEEFPGGENARAVEGVSVAVVGPDGPANRVFAISSGAHSPTYDPDADDRSVLVFEANNAPPVAPAGQVPTVAGFTVFAQPPADRWFLRLRADDNPSLAVAATGAPQRYRAAADGRPALDDQGKMIPDAGGRLVLDQAKLEANLLDVWWVFRYRYGLPGPAGAPVPFWAHFSTGPGNVYVAAGGATAAGTWAASDAPGAWSVTNGAMRRSGMGQGFMRSQTPMTWSELRLTADATLPTTAGAEVGLIVRQRSPADDGYRLRLVVLAAAAGLDAILEKVMGGTATTLAQRTGVQIAGGTTVRLELEADDGRIEAHVAGMNLLSATDPGPLPAGAVGLWGAGTGAAVSTVWVSDLAGRP